MQAAGAEEVFAAIRAREGAVRELLARIGTTDPAGAAFARAAREALVDVAEIARWGTVLAGAPAEVRAAARTAIRSLLALQAVVAGEVLREKGRTAELIARSGRARVRLASFGVGEGVGEGCDVAG